MIHFPISRRTALKLLSVTTIGGLLGYSRFVKPKPTIHQRDTLILPKTLNNSKQVVVIGGGLAGLASAYELSRRGFTVTLLEKAPQLGGKIASWLINVNGEEFMMEHGFHGFFPQYYNLKSIVTELNIEDHFKSLDFYSLVFKEGYKPEVFKPSSSAFPWNIVDLAIASPNRFQWGINLVNLKHLQVFKAITGFRIGKTYDEFDSISVADWVATDFPKGLYDLYFLPFAKSSLNAPDTLSAGELLQFFHFYFFGNPEGLAFNGTVNDMGRMLVNPIAESIINNGGKIITEATVSKINYQEGKIESIEYHQGNQQTAIPFWVEKNTLLTTDKEEYYGAGDQVYYTPPDSNIALSLTCTHQGCTVQRQDNNSFLCPCHGAMYNSEGKVQKNPAKRNLPQYQILQRTATSVQLVSLEKNPEITSEKIDTDYCIIASDIPGVKHLFTRISGDIPQPLQQQIDSLQVADPFAVARFWFDQDFEWEHSNFTSLSGYSLTDSITLYHRIQEQFIKWSKHTGGSVVELHAYCYKEKDFPTQIDLLNTFEKELYEIVPALKESNCLHRELVNQKNFAGYPPNTYDIRPESQSLINNLMFAGDWVKMPFPCGLMERAVTSGLLASNVILKQEKLQRRELLSVNPEGVLKI